LGRVHDTRRLMPRQPVGCERSRSPRRAVRCRFDSSARRPKLAESGLQTYVWPAVRRASSRRPADIRANQKNRWAGELLTQRMGRIWHKALPRMSGQCGNDHQRRRSAWRKNAGPAGRCQEMQISVLLAAGWQPSGIISRASYRTITTCVMRSSDWKRLGSVVRATINIKQNPSR